MRGDERLGKRNCGGEGGGGKGVEEVEWRLRSDQVESKSLPAQRGKDRGEREGEKDPFPPFGCSNSSQSFSRAGPLSCAPLPMSIYN